MSRRIRWPSAVSVGIAIVSLAGCLTLMTDPAPSDGRATLNYAGTQASMTLPVSARGRQLPAQTNMLVYGNELEHDHTVGVMLSIWTLPEEQTKSKSDEEILAWWMQQFEEAAPKAPGREGAVLRSFDQVGGTRDPAPVEGAHCAEYLTVNEDRLVPGHRGQPFIGHAREYGCVDPHTHHIVRLHFSERFPAEGAQLRATFEEDVDFLFDSFRLQ